MLVDGREITTPLAEQIIGEELGKIKHRIGDEAYADGHFELATRLFEEVALRDEWVDFLTLVGYQYLS
jgi:malate synthase